MSILVLLWSKNILMICALFFGFPLPLLQTGPLWVSSVPVKVVGSANYVAEMHLFLFVVSLLLRLPLDFQLLCQLSTLFSDT